MSKVLTDEQENLVSDVEKRAPKLNSLLAYDAVGLCALIRELAARVEQQERQLNDYRRAKNISVTNGEVQYLRAQLADRDKRIAELERDLAFGQKWIEGAHAQLAARDAPPVHKRVRDLEARIAELEERCERLPDKEEAIDILHAQLTAEREKSGRYRAHLRAMTEIVHEEVCNDTEPVADCDDCRESWELALADQGGEEKKDG